MSAQGTLLRLAYRLRRHLFGGWSLARWLSLFLAAALLWALFQWWPNFWLGVGVGCLLLVYAAWLTWAERRGYVYFVPLADARGVVEGPPLPPLRKQEWVPVRASGGFTVEGTEGHFVDLEADFETVGTREHIVLARLHPSRFLLVGRWPKYQIGWWYIFFMPAMLREVQPGHLYASSEGQLALCITYAPDEERQHTVYLTFDDHELLRRVWDDLLRDAPPAVGGPRGARDGA